MDTKRTKGRYPHLYITENMTDAIRTVPTDTWKEFFKTLEASRLDALKSCADKDLTTERGKLNMISELQGIFLTIHQHRNIKQQDNE